MFKRTKLNVFKLIWRHRNSHNKTRANNIFSADKVTVGIGTYGPIEIPYLHNDANVVIGNYCSIGDGVILMAGGVHDYKRISTYPFQTLTYSQMNCNDCSKYSIKIDDDVWIGYEAIILPGVHIGKGSVIGARSVVAKDVPPYSIYVQNRVIKKRFSNEIIEKIQNIDYSKIVHKKGDSYEKYCQTQIDESNVDEILKSFIGKKSDIS